MGEKYYGSDMFVRCQFKLNYGRLFLGDVKWDKGSDIFLGWVCRQWQCLWVY